MILKTDIEIQRDYWTEQRFNEGLVDEIVAQHKGKPITTAEAVYHFRIRSKELVGAFAVSSQIFSERIRSLLK